MNGTDLKVTSNEVYPMLLVPRSLAEAMQPMSQSEIEQRHLEQALLMRGMSDEDLARRYGGGLKNALSCADAAEQIRSEMR